MLQLITYKRKTKALPESWAIRLIAWRWSPFP